MGSHYLFKCFDCGYEAQVSGCVDVGMACKTVTVVCSTCHERPGVSIVVAQQNSKVVRRT